MGRRRRDEPHHARRHRRRRSVDKMRPAYRGIGLSPDGGMTWTLPRIVGLVGHGRSSSPTRSSTHQRRLSSGCSPRSSTTIGSMPVPARSPSRWPVARLPHCRPLPHCCVPIRPRRWSSSWLPRPRRSPRWAAGRRESRVSTPSSVSASPSGPDADRAQIRVERAPTAVASRPVRRPTRPARRWPG